MLSRFIQSLKDTYFSLRRRSRKQQERDERILIYFGGDKNVIKVKLSQLEEFMVVNNIFAFAQKPYSPLCLLEMIYHWRVLGRYLPLYPILRVNPGGRSPVFRCSSNIDFPLACFSSLEERGYFEIVLTEQEMNIVKDAQSSTIKFFDFIEKNPQFVKELRRICDDGTEKWIGLFQPKDELGEIGPRSWFQLRKGGDRFAKECNEDVIEDVVVTLKDHSSALSNSLEIIEFERNLQRLYDLQRKISETAYMKLVTAYEVLDVIIAESITDQRSTKQLKDERSYGADVLRAYKYFRSADSPIPLPGQCATSLHADMGLLTLSPRANLPGLRLLDPSDGTWKDVERNQPENIMNVFAGELFGRLTSGRTRAVLHYVQEEFMGQSRYSFPYFFRGNPNSLLPHIEEDSFKTVKEFMEAELSQNDLGEGHDQKIFLLTINDN